MTIRVQSALIQIIKMEAPAHPRVPFRRVLTRVFSEAVMVRIFPHTEAIFFAAVHTKLVQAGRV